MYRISCHWNAELIAGHSYVLPKYIFYFSVVGTNHDFAFSLSSSISMLSDSVGAWVVTSIVSSDLTNRWSRLPKNGRDDLAASGIVVTEESGVG